VIAFVHARPVAGDDPWIERDGRYIHLTTDLATTREAESMVAAFDAAVPQWAEFWNLPPGALEGWKVDACVMGNREEFRKRGRIPPQLPDFPFGYALDNQVWVLAQPSEYYTTHLLLHEGVHSLAFFQFGGAGPTWYREGTAELLATHRGSGSDVVINQVPRSRDDVPYWGRFKRMHQVRQEGAIPSLETVMGYQPDLRGDVETYGWSWAATMLLHAYPEYRSAFLSAAQRGRDEGPGFNRQMQRDWQDQWPVLAARWRLLCNDLDYGFDWSRERVDLSVLDGKWDGKPLSVEVSASRGWQSSRVRIPGRIRIQLAPAGQIRLADEPRPWTSEAAGITFQYHRGRPLGQLLAVVLPNGFDPQAETIVPIEVQPIEQPTELEIEHYSWLLFRVNDGLADLGDNQGSYRVTITRAR
jgi:hypothetical protein